MKFLALFGALVAGSVLLSALAQIQLQPLWALGPGARPYITSAATGAGNVQRGMTYNPLTGHVLVANRAGGPSINILDGTTGADLGSLPWDDTLISGGTFPINMIGAGADGAIYAGNLTLNGSTTDFRLYRWGSETEKPTLAFAGNPAPGQTASDNATLRYGDTMAVRGAGSETQILLGSRGVGNVSVLLTGDGKSFAAYHVTSDATPVSANNGPFGLGIAFGEGNTFWGKSSGGTPLRNLSVDVATQTATTIGSFDAALGVPASIFNIGTVPGNVYPLLVGIGINPDTAALTADEVFLFDISHGYPVLWDRETLWAGNEANVNGTGAVAYGGGKVFVLDTNNGLYAWDLIPEPTSGSLLAFGLLALWWHRRSGPH